eukprot:TRINITY_DN10028_c0_g1_i1.p1 TRINITY_DN10028_c0_g1~~TRINITY_DN10028_c0_g1_i1.p1  ORF type:complete len:847 (+),score=154.71 TRINITY_DN10028_c0_g1_i1:103-2643(+)
MSRVVYVGRIFAHQPPTIAKGCATFVTISEAVRSVSPKSIIRIYPGVYRENIVVQTSELVLESMQENFNTSRKKFTSVLLRPKTPTLPVLSIEAEGCIISGITFESNHPKKPHQSKKLPKRTVSVLKPESRQIEREYSSLTLSVATSDGHESDDEWVTQETISPMQHDDRSHENNDNLPTESFPENQSPENISPLIQIQYQDTMFSNCRFNSFSQDAVHVHEYCRRVQFDACSWIGDMSGCGIKVEPSAWISLQSCRIAYFSIAMLCRRCEYIHVKQTEFICCGSALLCLRNGMVEVESSLCKSMKDASFVFQQTSFSVRGCKIWKGLSHGILVDECEDVMLEENRIGENLGDGVFIRQSYGVHLVRNILAQNHRSGIFMSQESVSYISENTLDRNGHDGIVISTGSEAEIMYNRIESNSRHGLMCFEKSNILVRNNCLTGNLGYAVSLDDTVIFSLVDNQFDTQTTEEFKRCIFIPNINGSGANRLSNNALTMKGIYVGTITTTQGRVVLHRSEPLLKPDTLQLIESGVSSELDVLSSSTLTTPNQARDGNMTGIFLEQLEPISASIPNTPRTEEQSFHVSNLHDTFRREHTLSNTRTGFLDSNLRDVTYADVFVLNEVPSKTSLNRPNFKPLTKLKVTVTTADDDMNKDATLIPSGPMSAVEGSFGDSLQAEISKPRAESVASTGSRLFGKWRQPVQASQPKDEIQDQSKQQQKQKRLKFGLAKAIFGSKKQTSKAQSPEESTQDLIMKNSSGHIQDMKQVPSPDSNDANKSSSTMPTEGRKSTLSGGSRGRMFSSLRITAANTLELPQSPRAYSRRSATIRISETRETITQPIEAQQDASPKS